MRCVRVRGCIPPTMNARIGADQLADYAHRKGMPVDVMARWLAPNLADD